MFYNIWDTNKVIQIIEDKYNISASPESIYTRAYEYNIDSDIKELSRKWENVVDFDNDGDKEKIISSHISSVKTKDDYIVSMLALLSFSALVKLRWLIGDKAVEIFKVIQDKGNTKGLELSLRDDNTIQIAINYGSTILADYLSFEEAEEFIEKPTKEK